MAINSLVSIENIALSLKVWVPDEGVFDDDPVANEFFKDQSVYMS